MHLSPFPSGQYVCVCWCDIWNVAMCRLGLSLRCVASATAAAPRLQRILFGRITAFGSCLVARTWAPFGLQRIETSAACAYLWFIFLLPANTHTTTSSPSSSSTASTASAMATESERRKKERKPIRSRCAKVQTTLGRHSLELQLGQTLLDFGLTGRVFGQQAGETHVQVLHG